jgi:hypothetical protein
MPEIALLTRKLNVYHSVELGPGAIEMLMFAAQLTLANLMQRDIPGDRSEQRIAFGFL